MSLVGNFSLSPNFQAKFLLINFDIMVVWICKGQRSNYFLAWVQTPSRSTPVNPKVICDSFSIKSKSHPPPPTKLFWVISHHTRLEQVATLWIKYWGMGAFRWPGPLWEPPPKTYLALETPLLGGHTSKTFWCEPQFWRFPGLILIKYSYT